VDARGSDLQGQGIEGYLYEPCWIHPKDAEKRGIKQGDIVRVFNERGGVLCGALVWERNHAGCDLHRSWGQGRLHYPRKLDRGGAINTITPEGIVSKHCAGQATSGFLVEVEKVSLRQMGEWRDAIPSLCERI